MVADGTEWAEARKLSSAEKGAVEKPLEPSVKKKVQV